jgi:hypothetical protein
MRRPAETAGGVGAIGALLAYVWGVTDPETVISITAALGLLPGIVTGLVHVGRALIDAGGVRGVAVKLWRGKPFSRHFPPRGG